MGGQVRTYTIDQFMLFHEAGKPQKLTAEASDLGWDVDPQAWEREFDLVRGGKIGPAQTVRYVMVGGMQMKHGSSVTYRHKLDDHFASPDIIVFND